MIGQKNHQQLEKVFLYQHQMEKLKVKPAQPVVMTDDATQYSGKGQTTTATAMTPKKPTQTTTTTTATTATTATTTTTTAGKKKSRPGVNESTQASPCKFVVCVCVCVCWYVLCVCMCVCMCVRVCVYILTSYSPSTPTSPSTQDRGGTVRPYR